MPKQSSHINARCTQKKKGEYIELARHMGYNNFSEFLIAMLDSLNDRLRGEGWESHLVYVSEDRIVAVRETEQVPLATAAFPVVAPSRFWRHIEEHCIVDEISDDEST